MSYRNPQQVIDTQTGQHYRNLQNVISSTFAGVAQNYKAEQDKLAKEQKEREAKNKAIVDFNQKQEDSMMSSVAKLKANNPTLDTSSIYDMIDRYSDIKNAIDLGTITDKEELRKMREELAQIKSIPDGLNTSLVGFSSLTQDFNEYIAKAGKKGGLDLTTADPITLNHINVFLNNTKGERKFLTKFDENGNMQTGIFIKSGEEGDKGKFYTKDELTSYMSGKTGGLPTIYDDTKDQEEMKSRIIGKDPETNRLFVKKEYLSEKTERRKDGSFQVINVIDEEKVKNSLRADTVGTIGSLNNSQLLSFYNNTLKGKEGPVISLKDLQDEKKGSELRKNISEMYLEKFMKDNNLIDFSKKSYTYRLENKKSKKPKELVDTSYIDKMDITLEGELPGAAVDFDKLERTLKTKGFRILSEGSVDGKKEYDVTKSIKGADNSVTITEDMTPKQIKDLLKLVETGSLPKEEEPKKDEYLLNWSPDRGFY